MAQISLGICTVHSTVNKKVLIFFLLLHENLWCGYSLEAPSNEYPQHMFLWILEKYFVDTPILSGAMTVWAQLFKASLA